jgi:sec-independent protein translocase protein TatA
MFGIGTGELVLILLVVMVVFGSSKLPQLGEGLGTAIKSFKRAITSSDETDVTPKKSEIPGEQPKPGPAQSSKEAPKP